MITSLSIRDFQSIREADLDLGPLTVIVGPGNAGKTAAVRALKALALNRTGTDFIRHGQTRSVVIAETDDGHTVAWVKEKATASYLVDGQELTKLAKHVPEEVQTALGIRRLEVEALTFAFPQVHAQFDAPFLLAESPSKAARVIAKLTRLDVIVQAQTKAARDLKRVNSDLKERCSSLERAEEACETTSADAERAQGNARQVTAVYDEVCALEKDSEQASVAVETIVQSRAMKPLPDRSDIDELATLVARLSDGYKAYSRLTNYRGQLEGTAELKARRTTDLHGVEAALAAVDVCPLCGSELHPEKEYDG
ncbi:hypothetical protein LCGC14_0446490 [marine sediment metagenome]|uniref:Rad50/SbcC-type AAA domain-containing protein n=1 Tax=marine sediment metagenome TaxID=412755 RepID=A0A0F9SPX4_9ZZZZ